MANIKDPRFNELRNSYNEIVTSTKEMVSNLISTTFAGKYDLVSFTTRNINIGFQNGTYGNGNAKYCTVEIFHGYDHDWSEGKLIRTFKIETNISAYGTFNLIDDLDSIPFRYYMMVSSILTNSEFKSSLQSILSDLATKLDPIEKEMDQISEKYEEIERKEREERRQKVEENKFNDICSKLENATDEDYALVKKGDGGKFYYRGKDIQVVALGTYGSDLLSTKTTLERCYRPVGVSYAIVPAKKIKVTK